MTTPQLDHDVPSSGAGRSPARSASGLRPLIVRLHFYAGILIAPFILVAAVTGGLYAMAPTIESLIYSDHLTVDSTGPAAPLSEQVASAQRARPDLAVSAVRPAEDPGETTRVLFTDPTLGESERLAVFVDPATTQTVGELAVYGSSFSLPVRAWISELHRSLHLGEPGRLYSELAASWLWVIALGGVYLWVRRYRAAKRRDSDAARLATLDRGSRGRSRTLSWHGVVGIWIAVGLVFLSATGLTWSVYAGENVTAMRKSLSWTTPALDKSLTGADAGTAVGEHEGHEGNAMPDVAPEPTTAPIVGQIDSVLAIARQNGIDGKVEVGIPATADTAFSVAQTRQAWVLSNNSIAIDGATGQVVDVSWFADWPLAAKLSAWGIQLHMGVLFGLANQLALLALAVGLASVAVRGYILWWRRRPTRGDALVGRAPARGAWREIPLAGLVLLLVVTVAVGWVVPLLGVSLVAFFVVDVALGLRARTRARAGAK